MNALGHPERMTNVLRGEVTLSADPSEVLTTVLGSCIAVCMWDPEAGVGGMNHFLLPGDARSGSTDIKYGAHAMELLVNGLSRRGADRSRLKSKLFGGAAMVKHSGQIGTNNIAFAREFLRDSGIPCIAESVGGSEARRVRFWPVTGRAKLLIVPRMEADLKELADTPPVVVPPKADITLF